MSHGACGASLGSLPLAMTSPDSEALAPLTRRERLIELFLVVAMIYLTIAIMAP